MKNPKLTKSENAELQNAVFMLENPNFLMKLFNYIGKPIEKGTELLPEKMAKGISKVSQNALLKGLNWAIIASDLDKIKLESKLKNKIFGGLSGFGGGFFGLAGLAVELPITTIIMLKSISEIAEAEGEDLDDLEVRLSCLQVFAFGGRAFSDDGSETGYFAVRNGLADLLRRSSNFIIKEGIQNLEKESAPILLKLITRIAARFNITVTEKGMAQLMPVLGGIGGAIINLVFISHFEDMAKGHFTVRRLERKYGKEFIEAEYGRIAEMLKSQN